jgi:endonuclease/exonuclease/phosphatase family metal-dependent hydrolase
MALSHPVLHDVEYVEKSVSRLDGRSLRLACYNIERGLRLDSIIDLWMRHRARHSDIILLSEADRGMARSGNRHTAREFGAALGYSWAYAVEFVELTKGDRRERRVPGENQEGHIGNAILSRFPLSNLQVVRLPCFFDYAQRYMARIGSRIAIIADVRIDGRLLTVASVHLESDSSPKQRSIQIEALVAEIRVRDGGQPIIIGGDMNTTGLDVNRLVRSVLRRPWTVVKSPSISVLERIEPMFALLGHEGFEYRCCNRDGHTLRTRGYKAHLDWFFTKNVDPDKLRNPEVYRAFEDCNRFSDHQPVAIDFALGDTSRYDF